MKKTFYTAVLLAGAFIVLLFSNFKLISDDDGSKGQSVNFNPKIRPHEVYNDVRENLVVPPYVYYPPSKDNPLVYNNIDISVNTAPQNEPSVRISHANPNIVGGMERFQARNKSGGQACRVQPLNRWRHNLGRIKINRFHSAWRRAFEK